MLALKLNTSKVWSAVSLLLAFLPLAGCGGRSSATPPPPPQQISVSLTTAPPSSLTAQTTASLVATVTNDSTNQGVDWSCTPAANCGAFNPAHTASGAATTYTAPSATGNVTIVAAATAKPAATASATVAITAATTQISIALTTAPPSSLNVGATAAIAATVTNDSKNAGVDWTCTPAASCGTFNPAHTASGAPTTYTAPAAAGNVTIIAAATAQASTTASAAVTINAAGPKIAITLSTPPPDSLNTGATADIAATVTNDSTNAGVDWSCTPAGDCGSFSPAHTASGATTTYTAPADAGSVTIVAAATASSSTTASDTVTVNAAAPPGLSGNYAFYLRGLEPNSNAYSLAGSITLQASGAVTGGEQDFNDGTAANKSPSGGDQITGGTLSLGENERGTLTLITNNSKLGTNGTETFHVVEVNTQHLLIETFDNTATSSGSMDAQGIISGTVALSGAYSFAVVGKSGSSAEDLGGAMTADGKGGLTAIEDSDIAQNINRLSDTGTYTAEDSFGRGTITLGAHNFVYYAVKSENGRTVFFRLVLTNANETDAGSAVLQADDTTAFNTSFVKGNFAFVFGGNHTGEEGFSTAGQLTSDGAGNITGGFAEEMEDEAPTDALINGAITGTYTLPTNGVGLMTFVWAGDHHRAGLYPADPDINLLDPNSSTNGGGALLMTTDAHIGDGVLVPQSATAMPAGNFAFNFKAFNTAGETDGIGQIAITAGAITGAGDINDLFHSILATDADVSGTLTADTANPGRFTVPLTFMINGSPVTQTVVIYEISADQFVLTQTDLTQFSYGVLESQTASSGGTGGAAVPQRAQQQPLAPIKGSARSKLD